MKPASGVVCPAKQVAADYRHIVSALDKQARDIIAAEGLDPDEVFEWADRVVPSHRRKTAWFRHAMLGDTRYYRQLAREFIASNGYGERAPVRIQPGDTVKRLPDGRHVIQIPGAPTPMTLGAAKRLGLI